MSNEWRYTDSTHLIAERTLPNGATESRLVSSLPEDTIFDPEPMPTFDELVDQYEPEFENWLEAVAQSNGYKTALSCISYRGSAVAEFDGDALALFNWRDALYVWLFGWKSGLNGEIPDPIPSIGEIKAMAPQPEAYGWVVHSTGITAGGQTPPEQSS